MSLLGRNSSPWNCGARGQFYSISNLYSPDMFYTPRALPLNHSEQSRMINWIPPSPFSGRKQVGKEGSKRRMGSCPVSVCERMVMDRKQSFIKYCLLFAFHFEHLDFWFPAWSVDLLTLILSTLNFDFLYSPTSSNSCPIIETLFLFQLFLVTYVLLPSTMSLLW